MYHSTREPNRELLTSELKKIIPIIIISNYTLIVNGAGGTPCVSKLKANCRRGKQRQMCKREMLIMVTRSSATA